MADTINGVERYAAVAVTTGFNTTDGNFDRLEVTNLNLGDASTSATVYVSSPVTGYLRSMSLVDATGAATTDVSVLNNSKSDAAMVAATNITTVADTAYDLFSSLSTTQATLAVTKGDLITVLVSQAGGLCSGTLFFEANA